ncbi:MAG: pyridoxal phosphate-dependent aminotransferase [Cystobacterineae bacterium]|nr:pyridoxal phosphate-dependent aminotransferase [Cystobacterineae bacterium]
MPPFHFSSRTAFAMQPSPWALALEAAREKPLLTALTENNPTSVGLSPLVELPPSPRYTPEAQGLIQARKALAKALGFAELFEQLCLTSGSSEALGLIFKLLGDSGEEVLVGLPSYPLLEPLVGFEGLHHIAYPLRLEEGAFRWDIPLLEERVGPHTKAIVASSPQAPTGCCLLPEEVLALETFCVQHGLALVVDQVFALRQHSLAGRPWQCLTFVLGGLSKWLGLPQHKLAWTWVLGPQPLVQEALRRWLWLADAYLCVSTPVQEALPAWLPLAEAFQSRVETRCTHNHTCLARLVPPGAAWQLWPREAGWTAVLRIPIAPDEEALALALVEAGVVVWPGYFFDFPVRGFMVVSLLAEEAAFEEAASRMAQVLAGLW